MQKNDKLYFVDGTWSDGLVSAAKDVAQATGDLCEAANKASKDLLEIEFVIVSARNVSSATITLITAASVRGDVTSSSYSKLQNAGKAVTDATGQLVVAAESTRAAPATKFQVEFSKSGAKARAAEVDAQVNVLKMEKELERAREGLAGIRKAKYEAGTNPSSNVNFDSRKASSPHKGKYKTVTIS
jgi:talin